MIRRFIRGMGREFIISLSIHLCFFGAVIVFAQKMEMPREAILVYLADEMPGGGPGGSIGRESSMAGTGPQKRPSPGKKAVEKETLRSLMAKKSPARDDEIFSSKEKSADEPPVDRSQAGADAAGLSGGKQQGTDAGGGGHGTGAGRGTGPGAGGGTGSGYGTGTGNGRGAASEMNLKMQYLREHFAYIRDMIMKRLVYPRMAKRMEWKGRVVVAFVIRENGTVENARIVKSSGYDALDSNTISTIREVQPFPKPPVKAELVIPIVYKLE